MARGRFIALLALPQFVGGVKSSMKQMAIDADGGVNLYTEAAGETGRALDKASTVKPFKVMNWNILAEGLADDGFVVPLASGDPPLFAADNSWDKALALEDGLKYQALTAPLTDLEGKSRDQQGSMAAYIHDQEQIKAYVIKKIEGDFSIACKEVTSDKECCSTKALLKLLGQYTSDVLNTNFQLADEVKGLAEDTLKSKKCLTIGENDVEGKLKTLKDKLLLIRQTYINAVRRLDLKWGLSQFTEALAETIRWGSTVSEEETGSVVNSGRGQVLADRIISEGPDILALEENDHYRFFQQKLEVAGYRTTMTKGSMYARAQHCSVKKTKYKPGDLDTCARDAEFARVTKFMSNAQKFSDLPDADNDGVTIFWKEDRFQILQISKHYFDEFGQIGNGGGVLGVLLQDTSVNSPLARCIFAVATHLASGDSSAEEDERIKQMGERTAAWLEQELSDARTQEPKCEGRVGVVLMMDGNTYQNFAVGDDDDRGHKIEVSANAYHKSVLGGLKLHTFDLPDSQPEKEIVDATRTIDGRTDLPMQIAYSVNKIRGVHSKQPNKIGDYQLDRIDYIAVSDDFQRHVVNSLPMIDRFADRKGPDSPYNSILPSAKNPSDHLPIVCEVTWKEMEDGPVVESGCMCMLETMWNRLRRTRCNCCMMKSTCENAGCHFQNKEEGAWFNNVTNGKRCQPV